MYDAIVVGARCAGSATAMLLARRGLEVLLVDRATFASEIPDGHFIHQHGPRRLADWGLLDELLGTGCPPVTSVTMDFGDFPLTGRDLAVDGVPVGLGPRRSRLDRVLVDAAVRAGAELRQGFAVQDFTSDGDRITGVRGRDVATGSVATERATLVIGADGRNSGSPGRSRRRSCSRRRPCRAGTSPTGAAWPAPASRSASGRTAPRSSRFPPTTTGSRCSSAGRSASCPPSGRTSRAVSRRRSTMSPISPTACGKGGGRSASTAPPSCRTSSGRPAGRAGRSSATPAATRTRSSRSACATLWDAELLADALSSDRPTALAVADYERRRTEATLPDYHENLQAARLQPLAPEVCAARAALRGDQEQTNRFMMVREGMIAPESLSPR